MKTQVESGNANGRAAWRETLARQIGSVVFYALLVLIAAVAIPYGTVEPWWKALFQCTVFMLTGLCVLARWLWRDETSHQRTLLIPALALLAFAFIQTISWSNSSVAGVDNIAKTLSADPYQTRLFVIQLLALGLSGMLLVLQSTTQRRVQILVDLVIATAAFSACFGMLRQAFQSEPNFVLPYLVPGFGYAQFINRNHFAFLIEMGLGLALGIVACRGAGYLRMGLYLAAAIPMWVALIWANSRAGILSLLCQVLFLAWLAVSNWSSRRRRRESNDPWFRKGRVIAVRALLIIGLLVGAVITVVLFGGESLDKRLGLIPVELNSKTADAYVLRQNIWQATLDLIKDQPITGVGLGAYWIAISKYHHATGEITPQEAHSDYLELLASGGVIGLTIGLWFFLEFVRTARRKLHAADRYGRAVTFGALAGIMTVAVHSLVDFGLHITVNALVFTVLVSLVVINLREEAEEDLG